MRAAGNEADTFPYRPAPATSAALSSPTRLPRSTWRSAPCPTRRRYGTRCAKGGEKKNTAVAWMLFCTRARNNSSTHRAPQRDHEPAPHPPG